MAFKFQSCVILQESVPRLDPNYPFGRQIRFIDCGCGGISLYVKEYESGKNRGRLQDKIA
jgi:hypothetical protein